MSASGTTRRQTSCQLPMSVIGIVPIRRKLKSYGIILLSVNGRTRAGPSKF